MSYQTIQTYQFGAFQLRIREGDLRRDGISLALTPKAFETLVALVENRGATVSREDLMQTVWHDSFVEENSLTKNISTLRKVLGETDRDRPRFIETVARFGYRFIAPVTEIRADETGKPMGSLAVLPFKVFGAQPAAAQYLGLGLADVLITRLSNLRQIAVRSTSAVRKYSEDKTTDVVEIGRKLRVDWVLDGSLFHIGERVRATVQFVAVRDARSLWGEKFDVESSDLIQVQDSIVERATQILIEKLRLEAENPVIASTVNPAAFQKYLEGRFFWNKRLPQAMRKAVECFERAIEIDSDFALAHAGLGDAYLLFSQHSLLAPTECFPRAKQAARRAIELQPTLAEAHTTLAHTAYLFDWDWAEAELNYRRAIELNPNYAVAHHWYGIFLTSMNRLDQAIEELRRALELDPLSAVIMNNLSGTFCIRGNREEAIEFALKCVELDPHYVLGWRRLGWVYSQYEKNDQAISALEKASSFAADEPTILSALALAYAVAGYHLEPLEILRRLEVLSAERYVSKYCLAQVYAKLENFDQAFELLNQSLAERDTSLILLGIDPDLNPLRFDARFENLKRRLKLA